MAGPCYFPFVQPYVLYATIFPSCLFEIKAYETFSFKETKTLEIVMELCTGKQINLGKLFCVNGYFEEKLT